MPPKKPHILNILGEEKKDPKFMAPEEMMLDSIGCTSNVVFIDKKKKKVYVANAGDSRCVFGKNGEAKEMSVDHKPDCQVEIDRIEKSGSVITEGRVDGNLNLTRSLGDVKYKHREHLTPEEQAITANPDTYEFDLTNDIDFILMGCDGIWEKQSNEDAVKWVYEQIEKQKQEKGITSNMDLDLKQITSDLLLNNIATDVQSSGK
jgi:serine/threonine protein phosphatase PrpC